MGIPLLLASISFGQETASTSRDADQRVAIVARRSSSLARTFRRRRKSAHNPVDTYRPADIEKLGIRNATDMTTFLPQEAGGTTNLNIANGGDGTVQFNLRGL